MNATTATIPAARTRLTTALAVFLSVAAVAHIPATGHHAAETPYLGLAFAGFTTACVALLFALAARPGPEIHLATALLMSAAVGVYVLTRLVALPGTEHDVGHWLDPLGVTSVLTESAAAVAALRLLRTT